MTWAGRERGIRKKRKRNKRMVKDRNMDFGWRSGLREWFEVMVGVMEREMKKYKPLISVSKRK